MRRAATAFALGLNIAATAASGQIGPGAPPYGPEVDAAFVKIRAGDPAGIKSLVALADGGHAGAQTAASGLYIFGAAGLPKDGKKGCAYVRQASATRGDAMHLLAECYEFGYGGEKDLEKAVTTFRKAGDMGMAKSRCAEGNVLLKLNREQTRAVELCREGALAGDADAQTDLGNFYLQGKLVVRDMFEARRWYEKAAAQNQANAAMVLGQIYWNGDGVKKDNARAAELWRVAYAGGREDAAKLLGDEAFVRAGQGSGKWAPTGLEEARDWYAKAIDARNPEVAKEARERRDLSVELIRVMRKGPPGTPR